MFRRRWLVGNETAEAGEEPTTPARQISLQPDVSIVDPMELLTKAYEAIANTSPRQTKGELLEALMSAKVDLLEHMATMPTRDIIARLCEVSEAAESEKQLALNLAERLDRCEHKEAAAIARELRVSIKTLSEGVGEDDEDLATIHRLMRGDADAS